jgi:hypothetical protein
VVPRLEKGKFGKDHCPFDIICWWSPEEEEEKEEEKEGADVRERFALVCG